MAKVRVIPVLLLRNWGLEKSIRFRDNVYVGCPINAVRVFNGYGADEVILLDIIATGEGRSARPEIVSQIAREAFMPLTVGGGIRSVAEAAALLEAGADRVVFNTSAVEVPGLLEEAASRFGSQCVVVSIDARLQSDGSYRVCTRGGSVETTLEPAELSRQAEERGAGEVLITSIDRDGTMEGYDLDLVRQVAGRAGIPVIACGGAGSVEHLAAAVREGHASAAAAGAFFLFYGRRRTVLITYPSEDLLRKHFGEERVRAKVLPPPPPDGYL